MAYDESTWASQEPMESEDSNEITPCLTILSHPQMIRAGERALLLGLRNKGRAALSRTQPEFVPVGKTFGQPLENPYLSRKPIEFAADKNGIRLQIPAGIKLECDGEPVWNEHYIRAPALAEGVTLSLENRVCLLLHQTRPRLQSPLAELGMIGASEAMVLMTQNIQRIAALDVPVLIRGETGTGKELAAQALHRLGARAGQPFVSVNMAALPTALAASELFGATKGAFTGAAREHLGFFRMAHKGILFLDEIGEAPREVQTMLLRSLETGEIYPLGRQSPLRVDVRLIAATDADLDEMIAAGSFKEPLLHRLAGYEIRIPPLRERREDLGRLFLHFARLELEQFGDTKLLSPDDPRTPTWLPAQVCASLAACPWPGNVRQFRNVVRGLIIENRDSPQLKASALLDSLKSAAGPNPANTSERPAPKRKMADVTQAELEAVLLANQYQYAAAATQLGIPRSSLYDLIKRFGIPTAMDLDNDVIRSCYQKHGGDLAQTAAALAVSQRALKQRLKTMRPL